MTSSNAPKNMADILTNLKEVLSRTGKHASIEADHAFASVTSNSGSSMGSRESSTSLSRRPELAETMMAIAHVISMRSTCARRNVGAVLVDQNNRVLSIGHNGPARGMPHCTDAPCSGANCPSGTGLDLCQAIHAEQNALMFCSDIMKIKTCFVTTSPCVHCIKMLMNTSCERIIFAESYPNSENSRDLWLNSALGREWIEL